MVDQGLNNDDIDRNLHGAVITICLRTSGDAFITSGGRSKLSLKVPSAWTELLKCAISVIPD